MSKQRSRRPQKRARARSRSRKSHHLPRTADDFFAQAEHNQQIWNRVLRAISKMRSDGLSLKKAATDEGIDPRTVTRWAGRALKKETNGRYRVSRRDSLLRVLQIPTPDGLTEVALRSSRQASVLGRYWDAVQRYLRTGDASKLKTFSGKRIKDANGHEVLLITDTAKLNRLGYAGVLSFESLYARSA